MVIKSIVKRITFPILMAMMVFGMFTTMPLVVSAADGPIDVTMNPVGANYVLNQTAVPLKATFYYSGGSQELPDEDSPIKVQWYWSLTNSNTGRDNGQGETISNNWYTRPFEYQTTLTPTTNTVGVRYYYAVLEYKVRGAAGAGQETRYAVTEPARIEVITPDAPIEQSFQVKKVDENGNPLAGAVFSLVPDTSHTWGEKKSYEATSKADGIATFTVTEGAYILSEKNAPKGYTVTKETHIIWVGEEQVLEVVDYKTQNYKPYETLTFVNTLGSGNGACNDCCCWCCCIWSWIALILMALLAIIGWIAFFAKKGDRGDRRERRDERRDEDTMRRTTNQRV